jgi:hypothetical protein
LIAVRISFFARSRSFHFSGIDKASERPLYRSPSGRDSLMNHVLIDGFGLSREILDSTGFGLAQRLHQGQLSLVHRDSDLGQLGTECLDFIPQTLNPASMRVGVLAIGFRHIPPSLQKTRARIVYRRCSGWSHGVFPFIFSP